MEGLILQGATDSFADDLAVVRDLVLCDAPLSWFPDLTWFEGLTYLFAQTDSNKDSFDFSSSTSCVVTDFGTGTIGICGAEQWAGYGGCAKWRDEILTTGLPEEQLVEIGDAKDTSTEAWQLVEHVGRKAEQVGPQKLRVVAPPWHILRCFLSVFYWMEVGGLTGLIEVVPLVGAELPLDEVVSHSQGTLMARRGDLLFHETARIFKYRGRGVPASLKPVIDYLRRQHGAEHEGRKRG